MTTQPTTDAHAEHGATEHGAAEHGMSTRGYINIALILAAITALEVSTYYVDFGPLFLPALLIMMAVKFFTIAYVFMHLKFDKPILTRIFYTGLVLACFVYLIMLFTFRIFWSGQHI